jgi:hypothetical protein
MNHRREKKMNVKDSEIIGICFCIGLVMALPACAQPGTPHTVSGTVFYSDGTTRAPAGIDVNVSIINELCPTYAHIADSTETTTVDPYGECTCVFTENNITTGDNITVIAWNNTYYGKNDTEKLNGFTTVNVTMNILKAGDADGDGLNNFDEDYTYRTDRTNPDTDGGGENDNSEVTSRRNPLDPTDDYISPCFIATAAYGTPLHEDIDGLRDFRDEVLMTNPIGEAFVSTYYVTSPPIADALRGNEGLRTVTRLSLITPLVYLSEFMLNGIWVVFIPGLAAVLLYPRSNRKKILKSLLAGIGAILVFIATIFSLGFLGYTIPFSAAVGAYMLPFVIPISALLAICVFLNLIVTPQDYTDSHTNFL